MKTRIDQAQSANATSGAKSNLSVASFAVPPCHTRDEDTQWFPAGRGGLLVIWGFVALNFAALFFLGYVIWAKCQGD